MRLSLVVLSLACLIGCAATPPPPATSLVLNENLRHGVADWQREAATRFNSPVLIVAHGHTEDGRWTLAPDGMPGVPAESAAKLLRLIWPNRPLVFISCNRDGHVLHGLPNVFYSTRVTWATPGGPERQMYEGRWEWGASTITEFVEAR